MQKLPEVGHEFKDLSLLVNALTHSSYANERRDFGIPSYERQEFLGDAVLGMICAEYVFHNFPEMPEGEMTRLRSSIVCEKSLHELALRMNWASICALAMAKNAQAGAKSHLFWPIW